MMLVSPTDFALFSLSTTPGPFPQFSAKARNRLARFHTRRDLYLHHAGDLDVQRRYRLEVCKQMADKCAGCELALESHTPTFGAGGLQVPKPLNENGQIAHRRILLALQHDMSLECCPALPTLVAHLLLILDEVLGFSQLLKANPQFIIRMRRLQWRTRLCVDRVWRSHYPQMSSGAARQSSTFPLI
jgi:hypothetical protein